MCFIAVAVAVHPCFPFVVAANRDEIFGRPAAPLGFWETHPQLAAGRDLFAGGTWLGLTREGRFAALSSAAAVVARHRQLVGGAHRNSSFSSSPCTAHRNSSDASSA